MFSMVLVVQAEIMMSTELPRTSVPEQVRDLMLSAEPVVADQMAAVSWAREARA